MKLQLSNTIYGLKFAMEKNDFERLKSSSEKKRNDFVADPRFQARFREWKFWILGECRKFIQFARIRGGTSLKSYSNGLKSRSNGPKSYSIGLKSKQAPLLSIQIRMQLPVVWTNSTQLSVACLTKRKLYIFFPLSRL